MAKGEDPAGVVVWQVDENGLRTELDGEYDVDKGIITFRVERTKGLVFAVGYDEARVPSTPVVIGGGSDPGADPEPEIPAKVDEDGKVTVVLDDEKIEELVDAAKDKAEGEETPKVELDVSDVEDAVEVQLDTGAAESFADAEVDVDIKLPDAEIVIGEEGLETIVDAGRNDTTPVVVKAEEKSPDELTPEQDEQIGEGDTVVDVSIIVGSVEVDVEAEISLPYELKLGDDPDELYVWFMAEDGGKTVLSGTYDFETSMMTFMSEKQSGGCFVVGCAEGTGIELPAMPGTEMAIPAKVNNAGDKIVVAADAETVQELIDSEKHTVTFDAEDYEGITKLQINKATAESLADAGKSVEIKLPAAEIVIDKDSLAVLAGAGKTAMMPITVKVEQKTPKQASQVGEHPI